MSNVSITNSTTSVPSSGPELRSIEHAVLTSLTLGAIVILSIIGNSFVIFAIILDKNLRTIANSLILSLAVADLMVSICVMPISVVNEISTRWFLGPEACEFWIVADVFCCTASILNLVAIALDRYWAITDTRYMKNRSVKRITFMISMSWAAAFAVSIGQVLGWKDPDNHPDITGMCTISQDKGFIVFGTVVAFYVPAVVIIAIYIKVYFVVMAIIKKDRARRTNFSNDTPMQSLESIRERKATRTLSIVTGAFIICWLPFFIVILLWSLVGDTLEFHPILLSFVLWLGYCNSMINPIIYTIFSEEFRTAFRKRIRICMNVICCR